MAKKSDRAKGLSKADRAIWDHIARSIEPLESNRFTAEREEASRAASARRDNAGRDEAAASPTSLRLSPAFRAEDIARAMMQGGDESRARASSGAGRSPSRRENVPGLDRRTAEKLRRGKLEIEGWIDLHGMTRAEAHRQLRHYLTAAHIRGLRCVLVITGKGSAPHKTDDAPFMGTERRGILREAVPEWLRAPDLAHLVIDFRHAQRKDGGSGAFYVLLRRQRGKRTGE